jgi:hypothetical protein
MTKPISRAPARLRDTSPEERDAIEADARAVQATALFCDDIRLEAGGKVMLIGHYPRETCFLQPSATIDRCAVYTSAVWSGRAPPAGIQIRIDLPDRAPGFFPVQLTQITEMAGASGEAVGHLLQCIVHLRFSPLRPGDVIQAFIRAGGTDFPTGRLLIRRFQPPAPPAPNVTRH